jgi:glycosidase
MKGNHLNVRIAIVLLFLFPGSISWYYGDEIDLDWNNKKNNRGTFQWDKIKNNETHSIVRKIIEYRKKHIKFINLFPKLENKNKDEINLVYKNGHIATINVKTGEFIIKDKSKEVLKLNLKGRGSNND